MHLIRKPVLLLSCFFILMVNFKLFAALSADSSQQFSRLAKEYENSLLDYLPELGLIWGKKDVALDRFMDPSLEQLQKWEQKEDAFLAALNKIDEKLFSLPEQYYTYLLLKETLKNKKASRICKIELWDVNPASGWHNNMAMVAQRQPVGTPVYRELALKRWRTFDRVVNEQINNLKIGLSQGYTAPKPAVDRVLMQLKMIVNTKVNQSPFFDLARRDDDEVFKRQVSYLIKNIINKSLKHYIHFLEKDYRPFARDAIGVSVLPSGLRCYQAKIKEETTLAMEPSKIHQLGLQYMQKLSAEVAKIGLKKYGITDMTTILHRAKNESANYFSSEQAVLNYNLAALERVKSKASNWFDMMPKAEAILKPYPAYRAQTGASGEYYAPSEDSSEPGIFYINTYQPEKRSRIDQEATLFHELIPGHHFQIALSLENKKVPRVNRYLLNSGYTEGWALYTERLAEEMGLYSDDISRLGMLSNEALRAARLVVDTGIHVMNWHREEAINYLTKHTALSADLIEGEVDRYIMLPGQATAYMLGKIEIENLRDLAKQQLGSHFDIRQFHNQVLKNGATSLPLLRAQINTWLKEISH